MPPIRHAYVDTPGGQVHAHMRAGTGYPIIFIHQTALSVRSIDPLLAALTLDNPLVALDIPGFGNSTPLAGWPKIADYAAELIAAIDGLGIAGFHLFGHHTGAAIAVEIASALPDRVRSAMLCGLPVMTADERAGFAAALSDPIAPLADGTHLLANWRYTADHNTGASPEIVHDAVVDMLRNWRARPQAYGAIAGYDVARASTAVQSPILLSSAPGDYFHAHLDRAKAPFPDAQVAITGGDNLQTSADPDGLARAIENFLAVF